MTDAILINPKGFKLINDQTIPFGLLYTASFAIQEYKIAIIDQRVQKDWKKLLIQELKKTPLVAAVTCMTGPMIIDALELTKLVKEHSPTTKTVWGGIHPSLLPEQTIKNDNIDMVIVGEGEYTFHELLNALSGKKDINTIEGLWWKDKEGNIKQNNARREIKKLDEIPLLPYHLIDIEKHYIQIKEGRGNTRSLNVFTSRGCPHKCTYCYNLDFNKAYWRQMGTERAWEEIKHLVDKHKLKNIFILDDNFFVNTKRAKEIAEHIHNEKWDGFTWDVLGAQVSTLQGTDDDYLTYLKKTGCNSMMIGIETGSPRIMKLIKKAITVEQVLDVNKKLNKANIKPYYSFMCGFPSETPEDVAMTLDLLFRVKKENPQANVGTLKPVMIYPGTEIYRQALEQGWNAPKKLEEWADITWGNFKDIEYPWLTRETRKRMVHLYYYTLLLNSDHLYINSKLFYAGVSLLSPIAKWRLQKQNFSLPIESMAINFVQKNFM
ncbi:MAG: radical SAM protein [Nanoarchaeota archaeon]